MIKLIILSSIIIVLLIIYSYSSIKVIYNNKRAINNSNAFSSMIIAFMILCIFIAITVMYSLGNEIFD